MIRSSSASTNASGFIYSPASDSNLSCNRGWDKAFGVDAPGLLPFEGGATMYRLS
jgi:hypothetical protein